MFTGRSGRHFIVSTFVVALLAGFAGPAQAYFAPANHAAANLVLGQPRFTTRNNALTQTGMDRPEGVAVDPTTYKVFVADNNYNRVLRFASLYSLANGAAAEAVLGQPNFTSSTAHTTKNGMAGPTGVFVDSGGRLWVADYTNNRVLRFDGAASKANGANANGVLGQPGFTSNAPAITQAGLSLPSGVFTDSSGRLWVADQEHNRILRFDSAASAANGANASAVLGQPDFTSSTAHATQSGMANPWGMFLDDAGRLWVADQVNNRVLRFDGAAAKANGANADGVLGQPDFTSTASATTQNGMRYPVGVAFDNAGGRLYVAGYGQDRILVFNSAASLANGANASYELGQPDFITAHANGGGLSASSMMNPAAVFFDQTAKVLLDADAFNNRVLIFGKPTSYFSTSSVAADDGWVLESGETSNVGGTMSASGNLRVGDDASNKQYRSFLSFDTSGLPNNAVIRSVTLTITKAGGAGTDPFTVLGNLQADIKDPSFGTTALETSDFQGTASAGSFANFTALTSQPGVYQVTLPAADYVYVNLAGKTQFRLHFSTDDNNNLVADYDSFYAGDSTTSANRPVIYIQYTLP